ncbi:hypothetical protein ZEAMMB73_Zm00001d031038 [Zea mays]|jgi:hypothetical protein|uniref:Uncharacterized protein n=1 Tax=Zea mays TaxID=4577 RepID=A0A096PHQ9_MAIZE|nr:hypothetical protein ZEAMMB73_Zm00001d031030 [Zea mays]ONM02017.1 hypothetical protein ZEAMMB73_Zm00001d031031 [Zea mays]ONM02020.1 hypothetical protein ZEAMMB73_Zm00001d031034 [Zea mays]ONM02023.1 hypothetical protein ZEAMMB73_Zm00001d031038 [Zea mays]
MATQNKTSWPELVGQEINDAIAVIEQERPDVTLFESLDVDLNETPRPSNQLAPGAIRVVIYFGTDPVTNEEIVEETPYIKA